METMYPDCMETMSIMAENLLDRFNSGRRPTKVISEIGTFLKTISLSL